MKSVFISSTFRDMQIERDVLHTRVFPSLNEEALKYSEVFSEIDLRWGIHTSSLSEEDADKKAFLTCFEEIDSSRPYFIAFLGDRYGTSVNEKTMSRLIELILNKDKMTKKEIEQFIQNTSITQKEIEYAAFISNIAPSHCFFFFRKSYGKELNNEEKEFWVDNDLNSKNKLNKLKHKIQEKYPNSFYEYNLEFDEKKGLFFMPEHEIKKVTDYICKVFLSDYKSKNNSPHEAIKQQMAFISKERNFSFFGREKEYKKIKNFLESIEENILILSGTSGYGKTSLLCHLIETEKDNYDFLPIFIGSTPSLTQEKGILKYLLESLSSLLGLDPGIASDEVINDESDYRNVSQEIIRSTRIKKLLSTTISEEKKPLVIILDSVNAIHGSPIIESLSFIPMIGLGFGIKFIISTTDSSPLNLFRCQANCLVKYELEPLEQSDIKTISNKVLSKVFHKDSSFKMIDNILNKENSNEPLYLLLLLRRLLLIGRYDFDIIYKDTSSDDARYKYIESLIDDAPNDSEKMVGSLFEKVIEFSSAQFLKEAFSFISLSPFGLTVQDLSLLVPEFDESDFYIAIRFLETLIYHDEMGRISFSHERINETARNFDRTLNASKINKLNQFFKDCGPSRFNERVELIFDNYNLNNSLVLEILDEEKEKNINPLIFDGLFKQTMKEFENGEHTSKIIFDILLDGHYYVLLSRILKKVATEARLDQISYKFVAKLCELCPLPDKPESELNYVIAALYALLLSVLKTHGIESKIIKKGFFEYPKYFFSIGCKTQNFNDAYSLMIVSAFSLFGISSYEYSFVQDFLNITKALGKGHAIYNLRVKEMLLLENPDGPDQNIKIENLLGEATDIKNTVIDSEEIERFIMQMGITYFESYSKSNPALKILKLAEALLINNEYQFYLDRSFSFQKYAAHSVFIYAKAAFNCLFEIGNAYREKAYLLTKRAFLICCFLAENYGDEKMLELAIDSLRYHFIVTSLIGLPVASNDFSIIDKLVKKTSVDNDLKKIVKGKHYMLYGFILAEEHKYEEAEHAYLAAIDLLIDLHDFYAIASAFNDLAYCQSQLYLKNSGNTTGLPKVKTGFSEMFKRIMKAFEIGEIISVYDCSYISLTISEQMDEDLVNDENIQIKKLKCLLNYCIFYQSDNFSLVPDLIDSLRQIYDYYNKNPNLKEEFLKFENTIRHYDPTNLIQYYFMDSESLMNDELVSVFTQLVDKRPFEAYKLLNVIDRHGVKEEKTGDLKVAADLYNLAWFMNDRLIKKYQYSFGLYEENLISIEVLERTVEQINGFPDSDLCMHFLINYAKLLLYSPFRDRKKLNSKLKNFYEKSLSICIYQKKYDEHFSFFVEAMDKYFSDGYNFENRFEYENGYVLFSYYRILYGLASKKEKHITKGLDDIYQSFSTFHYKYINNLDEIMDEAELAALVTTLTMFRKPGIEKEISKSYEQLPILYPEALESDSIQRIKLTFHDNE